MYGRRMPIPRASSRSTSTWVCCRTIKDMRSATVFGCSTISRQRTVLGREIVEHPNTVADRISFIVRQQTHVDVERLEARGIGIRRPYIQATEFELRSQHGLNQLQDFWPPYG